VEVDPDQVQIYARINRSTATPDVVKEIFRIDWETDIRAILPSIHTPAALVSGTDDNVDEARHIASLMPNATLYVLEGRSGLAVAPILAIVREMAGVMQSPPSRDRILATVLFTDIVSSTEQAARLGDTRWRELLGQHHEHVRPRLERFEGHEINTTGDGFLATFDGPARAVRCALDICQAVRSLGLEVRAGIHTGELERIGDDVGGIAVHIGARVSALANAGQVLVSRTVVDLVAGSGLQFDDHGEHQLKGIPGTWHPFAVRS
jgi:class 3 adenylate cyclase